MRGRAEAGVAERRCDAEEAAGRPLPASASAVRRARRRGRRAGGGGRRARACCRPGRRSSPQGDGPVAHLRVIRSGAVEIVADGRLLDLLGEGELFGHASMLSGSPRRVRGARGRGHGLLPDRGRLAQGLLSAPAGLRFVARSLLEPPTELHALAREPAATSPTSRWRRWSTASRSCAGRRPRSAQAAERMTAARQTSVVVDLGERRARDPHRPRPAHARRRRRPVGRRAGVRGDVGARPTPAPRTGRRARSCSRCSTAAFATSRSCRRGGPCSGSSRTWIWRRCGPGPRSTCASGSRGAAAPPSSPSSPRELRPMVMALHDAHVAAANVMAVYAVVVDALTRRAARARAGTPSGPAPHRWSSRGWRSAARRGARRCPARTSTARSSGSATGRSPTTCASACWRSPARSSAGLERCGLRTDEHGANASDPAFVRSLASWQRVARSWIAEPTQEKALILASVVVDSRPVWGVHTGTPVSDTFRLAPSNPALLRLLARFALSHRPPTGFFRGSRGRAQRRAPRPAGPQAGRRDPDRRPGALGGDGRRGHERLHDRAPARRRRRGTLSAGRRAHAAGRVRADQQPAPRAPGRAAARRARSPTITSTQRELSALMRTHLKEAFRAIDRDPEARRRRAQHRRA